MRNFPKDELDQKELDKLKPAKWMVDLLKCNPSYTSWGVHEDYMSKRSQEEGTDSLGRTQDSGWESRKIFKRWEDFNWKLDELNECVNFYFEINRDSKKCPMCCGNGYHTDAQWVSESFYKHSSPFTCQTRDEVRLEALMVSFGGDFSSNPHGRGVYPSEDVLSRYGTEFRNFCEEMAKGDGYWNDKITQEEVDELVKQGRLWSIEHPTAKEVNRKQNEIGSGFIMHDAINRSILIRHRLERFGIPVYCNVCDGDGRVFTEKKAHLSLTVWIIHPRKGASRGVEIERIEQKDLEAVQEWLVTARDRNAERFSKVSDIVQSCKITS